MCACVCVSVYIMEVHYKYGYLYMFCVAMREAFYNIHKQANIKNKEINK